MHPNTPFYLLTFSGALILSLVLTPAARAAATVLNVFDRPTSEVKTHTSPVPYLGGVAIFLSFIFALLWVRSLTDFPTGTLRSLRGIMMGGAMIFLMGLVDDSLRHGLHYRYKFLIQVAAAALVVTFGVSIKFIQPSWLAVALSIVWIVGVTNALNIIDIMDGLSSSLAAVAALAFLFISLPTEAVYVNFAAAALAGAVLGFLPYNLSTRWRIFMGDSGSLFLGFVLAALAMGTSYEGPTEISVFAPLLILALPVFDTVLVFVVRMARGRSPFLGSKDHFPLRLERLGWTRRGILASSVLLALVFAGAAFAVTQLPTAGALAVYGGALALVGALTVYVMRARMS